MPVMGNVVKLMFVTLRHSKSDNEISVTKSCFESLNMTLHSLT